MRKKLLISSIGLLISILLIQIQLYLLGIALFITILLTLFRQGIAVSTGKDMDKFMRVWPVFLSIALVLYDLRVGILSFSNQLLMMVLFFLILADVVILFHRR